MWFMRMSCCFARASGLYGIFPSAGSIIRLPGPAIAAKSRNRATAPTTSGRSATGSAGAAPGAPPPGAPPPRAAPPPPRPPPRAGAGSISVIAGGFQNPCMSGWPSGSRGMGPAGAAGGPPLPRPCPASGATNARDRSDHKRKSKNHVLHSGVLHKIFHRALTGQTPDPGTHVP